MADTEYTPPKVWIAKPALGRFANINKPTAGAQFEQGIADRQAPVAALFAGHAERRQSHRHARRAAGEGPQGRRVRRLADPHRRRRPVWQRVRQHQPELENPGDGRPQRPEAVPHLRDRGDPHASGREVRRIPADRDRGARRMPVMAVLADGQHALCRRRLWPFLRLRPDQDRVRDRPLYDGGKAPARCARQAAGRERVRGRPGVHDRRHGDLAVVWRVGEVQLVRRRRVHRGAELQERACAGPSSSGRARR